MVDIPTGSINVRKLPGDRDGATHYVTEGDMIYLVERNRLNYIFLLLWIVWNCTVCKEIIIIPLYKIIIHIYRDHVCYLHCRLKESLDCGSRMILRNGVYALTGTAHNHGAETQELRRIALVNECVTTAAAQPGNLSDIFREIHRNRYNLKCCFVNIHYLICLTCSFLTW